MLASSVAAKAASLEGPWSGLVAAITQWSVARRRLITLFSLTDAA
jgi:hypothetical protein